MFLACRGKYLCVCVCAYKCTCICTCVMYLCVGCRGKFPSPFSPFLTRHPPPPSPVPLNPLYHRLVLIYILVAAYRGQDPGAACAHIALHATVLRLLRLRQRGPSASGERDSRPCTRSAGSAGHPAQCMPRPRSLGPRLLLSISLFLSRPAGHRTEGAENFGARD
jgi:hypothetical protein